MSMDSRSTDYKTLCSERLLHSSTNEEYKASIYFQLSKKSPNGV